MKDLSTYFDYAAATPVDQAVLDAMQPYWSERFFNPSALYLDARDVRRNLEAARMRIAQTLGARPSEIVFTAGGTESINLAIQGIMAAYPNRRLVVSSIEHPAVLEAAAQYEVSYAPVSNQGIVDPAQLGELIDDHTVLVSVMLANHEMGAIQPIHQLSILIAGIRHDRKLRGIDLPLFLHSDACQAAQTIDVHVSRLGVDLLTLNGGKMYGPKQSGLLYIHTGTGLRPLIRGGGQEWGVRSGTENVAFAVGLSHALAHAQAHAKDEARRLRVLRDRLVHRLSTIGAQLNGPHGAQRLAGNIHMSFAGHDNERLLMELDELGFLVATGSACSAGSDTPSHVLAAMGVGASEARCALRISMGKYTTADSCDALVEAITKTVAKA